MKRIRITFHDNDIIEFTIPDGWNSNIPSIGFFAVENEDGKMVWVNTHYIVTYAITDIKEEIATVAINQTQSGSNNVQSIS